jgi:hypothetical protein
MQQTNYRPVSLTSICCTIQEAIITSTIRTHLEENKVLTDCQHGFRPRRSCETQMVTCLNELAGSLDTGKQQDILILDFSKAFDTVPHERLLLKVEHYGITGKTYKWIESFLTNRSQRVQVEGVKSDSVLVISGVPQGSVLGPLLFLIYINDIPECVWSSIRLLADGCNLYREIKNQNDVDMLQEDLNRFADWEDKWGMRSNPEKCSSMNITKSQKAYVRNYTMKGTKLKSKSTSKYLGVHIQPNLEWKTHVDKVVKKANSTPGFL